MAEKGKEEDSYLWQEANIIDDITYIEAWECC